MKRALVAASLVGLALLSTACFGERVDAGYSAVVIDYAKGTVDGRPSIRPVPVGTWVNVNWITEKLVKFPTNQQSLVMVRPDGEGQVKGDDSVDCNDRNGVRFNVDSRTLWRIDPAKVGDIYLMRPGEPLSGANGKDISSNVVRGVVRSAVADVCSQFRYDEVYGPKRPEFAVRVEEALKAPLARVFMVLDQHQLGEVYLLPQHQEALSKTALAQQDVVRAQYLQQVAQQEAAAAIAKAEGERKVAEIKAQADAAQVRIRTEAEVNAMRDLAGEYKRNPEYANYLMVRTWDGKLPQYFGGTGSPFVFPVR